MQKHHRNHVFQIIGVLLVFALLFQFLTMLLQPKYMDELVEGSMVSQYYDEFGGHDVIFIGDCEVYANFTPMEMFRSHGVTAYVRGTSQQLIWQSYYLLAETFSYEVPDVVVYNVNAMRYSEPVSEPYNRLTLDQMRWSRAKVDMILASMTDEESFLSYVFPILRSHSRFNTLTVEDFTYLFQKKQNTWNGHLINTGVKPSEALPAKRPLANYEFSDICYTYLDKMRTLCEEHDVELILIKAPSVYPYWYDEYDAQIRDYAQTYGITYYNLLDHAELIGLDYSLDTYDGGLHLNLTGAEKLSVYFADLLVKHHGITDRRNDPEISREYGEKLENYDKFIEKKRNEP